MAQYTLTEAYSEIYNPQKVDELFDNLRFIDYMLDEDIEEVVESLVWEFRDYGNTLDESFDLLSFAASDDVICESYDQLVEDILYEATVTKGSQRGQFAGSARGMVTSGRGDILAASRANKKLGRKTARAAAQRQADEAERQTQQRREARRARVDGAISRVKSAMAGAKGGMGRAAKALGGAARKAGSVAAGVAQKGKALLGSLLRKGATAAGKGVYAAGKAIEGSGRAAAAAPATTRTARVGRTTVTTTTEPGGSKRQAVGRAVRKVGAAIQRMGKSAKPKGTVLDPSTNDVVRTTAAPRTGSTLDPSASDVVRATAAPRTGPTRASLGNVRPSKALSGAIARQTAAPRTGPSSSERKYPTEPSGQTTLFTKPVKGKPVGKDVKIPAGGQRKFGKQQKSKPTERTRQTTLLNKLREDYDLELLLQYLSEDIISAGYADTIEEAYDVIEDLDENTLSEVLYEYID